ncbi:hypothetical protein C8R45DRAFT_973432 [Mycena sanguinolenta]|nr:hypothetical protein C8R45DRAFT_973432 [Mycena sanguinolenta]
MYSHAGFWLSPLPPYLRSTHPCRFSIPCPPACLDVSKLGALPALNSVPRDTNWQHCPSPLSPRVVPRPLDASHARSTLVWLNLAWIHFFFVPLHHPASIPVYLAHRLNPFVPASARKLKRRIGYIHCSKALPAARSHRTKQQSNELSIFNSLLLCCVKRTRSPRDRSFALHGTRALDDPKPRQSNLYHRPFVSTPTL